MKAKLFAASLLLAGTTCFHANSQSPVINTGASPFFALTLKKGEKLANIYSRAIAFTGDDFAPLVFRVSGTSYYEVLDDNPAKPTFKETDLYDGRPPATGVSMIGLDGKGTYEGKTFTNASASGLLYSTLIWGNAPATLKEGDTWAADISVPWELGGPGKQTITVIAIDAKHNTITLKRDGTSEGFFDNDRKELEVTLKGGKKTKMNIAPGTATWTGYTTFKNGIVMADELLVTRPVTLATDGLSFSAQEREYILLNAMPSEK